MNNYDVLFEDEDDIFSGTPQSKYWDIADGANKEIVKDEFDKIVQKYATMEAILAKHYSEDELEKQLIEHPIKNSQEIQNHKKSLYIEFTTNIVMRLDS